MKLSVNVRRRIIINGKEYGSVEELPPDVRQAYGKAMALSAGVSPAAVRTEISFNGRTYDSVDAMPDADRELYRLAMNAVEMGEPQAGVLARVPTTSAVERSEARPIEPESSFSARWLMTTLLLLGLLVALLYLRHG
jgi:hypothetical protein